MKARSRYKERQIKWFCNLSFYFSCFLQLLLPFFIDHGKLYFVYLGDYCGYLIRFVYYNLNFTCQWEIIRWLPYLIDPRLYQDLSKILIIHLSLTIPLELAHRQVLKERVSTYQFPDSFIPVNFKTYLSGVAATTGTGN